MGRWTNYGWMKEAAIHLCLMRGPADSSQILYWEGHEDNVNYDY